MGLEIKVVDQTLYSKFVFKYTNERLTVIKNKHHPTLRRNH